MAIVKMYKVSIIALEQDKPEILQALMNIGVMDITDMSDKAMSEEWAGILNVENPEDRLSKLEEYIEKTKTALSYLSLYDNSKKTLFETKRKIDENTYREIIENQEKLWAVVEEINRMDEKLKELKSEENRNENLINSLIPWSSAEIPLDLTNTRNTTVMYGVIPASEDINRIISDIERDIQECWINIINSDKEQTYLQIITHNSRLEELNNYLRQNGFNKVNFDLKGTVKENIEKFTDNIKKINEEREKLKDKIIKYLDKKNELEVLYDHLNIQHDKIGMVRRLVRTNKVFMLEGWIPSHSVNAFKDYFSKINAECALEIREPEKDEEYPVLLENNRFVQPFEVVTELYSMPKTSEFDPNPYLAPFFFMFFGLMLGDAGYGIMLSLVTAFIIYKYKPEGTMGKMMRLMFWCGISTTFWGAMFGGWFGDIVDKVTSGRVKINPIWFNPMDDPMKLLVWSFIFGGVHLYTAMGLNAYKLIREGKILDAIYDVGFWYVLLTGLVLLLAGGTAAVVGKYMTIIGAVLLVLTQGRNEKNIIKRLGKGILSLYNATSFVSDVLSYSRLLALGLSTGIIASVINTMGTLFGLSIPGIIVLLIVFVIGHGFNILINILGAFVHSSRLQYVEFFGKFYEGGGKAYKPFKINTKYIDIIDRRKM